MNKLFQHIQFFVECRDAESIEPMGYLIEIVCHARNRTDELHFLWLDLALYFCICYELPKNSVREIEASRAFPNKV